MSCKEDIEDIIVNMRTNETCGLNSIPVKILKKCINDLEKALSYIIALVFQRVNFQTL